MADFTISGEEFHPRWWRLWFGSQREMGEGEKGLNWEGFKGSGRYWGEVIAGRFHFQEGEREIRGEEGADMRDPLGGEREREKGSWAGSGWLDWVGPRVRPSWAGAQPFPFFCSIFSSFYF
jgi:hypothetical protein